MLFWLLPVITLGSSLNFIELQSLKPFQLSALQNVSSAQFKAKIIMHLIRTNTRIFYKV